MVISSILKMLAREQWTFGNISNRNRRLIEGYGDAYASALFSDSITSMVYSPIETTEAFQVLSARYADLSAVFRQIVPDAEVREEKISSETNTAVHEYQSGIAFLKEGQLALSIDDMTMILFEQGDAIGIETLSASPMSFVSDFAVVVERVSDDWLQRTLATDETALRTYQELFSCYSGLFACLVKSTLHEQIDSSPHVLHFDPGSVIVREGEIGDNVYTLVEGNAEVTAAGTAVGEIAEDEIFGALAAFGDGLRTATVTAITPCTVLSLPKERFIDLMRIRPQTVSKMVVDLAKKMSELNAQVVALKGKGDS